LKCTQFAGEPVADVIRSVRCVLHGAADWEGGRKERIKTESKASSSHAIEANKEEVAVVQFEEEEVDAIDADQEAVAE